MRAFTLFHFFDSEHSIHSAVAGSCAPVGHFCVRRGTERGGAPRRTCATRTGAGRRGRRGALPGDGGRRGGRGRRGEGCKGRADERGRRRPPRRDAARRARSTGLSASGAELRVAEARRAGWVAAGCCHAVSWWSRGGWGRGEGRGGGRRLSCAAQAATRRCGAVGGRWSPRHPQRCKEQTVRGYLAPFPRAVAHRHNKYPRGGARENKRATPVVRRMRCAASQPLPRPRPLHPARACDFTADASARPPARWRSDMYACVCTQTNRGWSLVTHADR